MSAPATQQAPPSLEEVLRVEVGLLREENAELRELAQRARLDASGWEREATYQQARRETTLDLAGIHVRAFAAFFEHMQRELAQDAEEEKADHR